MFEIPFPPVFRCVFFEYTLILSFLELFNDVDELQVPLELITQCSKSEIVRVLILKFYSVFGKCHANKFECLYS